jgi:hypothetical protein
MNLGTIYEAVLAQLGKDTYGGFIDPPTFNLAINKVNLDLTEQYIQVTDQNQNITDDTRQFVKTLGDNLFAPLTITSYGYGTIPSDYVRLIDAAYEQFYNDECGAQVKYRPIEILSKSHFEQRLRAGLYEPSLTKPIATIQNERILVRPQGIPTIKFTYFRTPATPFYDFDIVTATDQPIYLPPDTLHGSLPNTTVNPDFTAGDASESVEFEWDTPIETSIVDALVRYFRVVLKDALPPQEYQLDPPPIA